MSENVNLLIDKMNQESLKRKRISAQGDDGDRPGSIQIRSREQEITN
jgi:hypothetical protein